MAVEPGAEQASVEEAVLKDPAVSQIYLKEQRFVSSDALQIQFDILPEDNLEYSYPLYEGRAPKYGDEIAINQLAADRLDVGIGDEIELRVGNSEGRFLVTGFTEGVQNYGQNGTMTGEGYRRLDAQYSPTTIWVKFSDPAQSGEVAKRLRTSLGEDAQLVGDWNEFLEANFRSYISLSAGIAISVLLITAVVIVLVATLTTSSFIQDRGRDLGILRALGFGKGETTRIALAALLPATGLGCLLGLGIGVASANGVLQWLLSAVGIHTLQAGSPIQGAVIIGIGILILSCAIVIGLTGWRNRRR